MNKDSKSIIFMPVMLAYDVIAILLLIGYVYIYQYAPLDESLNDTVLNTITAFAALLVAAIATAIYLHYQPADFPRKIWLYLMIGCWFWFIAESLWGIIVYIEGEVSSPSIADTGWVGGFVFFTIAFYHQYSIIYPSQKKNIIAVSIGAWALAVFAPAIGLLITRTFTWESYINYYYPVADLFVGIAGIALMFVFQGGALARPWFGLVVLGISDFLYAWAEQTGVYAWSAANSNLLTLAIDTTYLVAYLILGMGFLGHWILINYGLRGKR